MNIHHHLDENEKGLALAAAEILKIVIRVARDCAETNDARAIIDSLQNCRLTVAVVGQDIQLELVADVAGRAWRIYGITFTEAQEGHLCASPINFTAPDTKESR